MIGILLGRALSENIMGEELTGANPIPEQNKVRVDHDTKDVDVNDILGLGEMIQNTEQQNDNSFDFGS